jgi:LemA protein
MHYEQGCVMEKSDIHIPEKLVPRVFGIASQLYAQKNQEYSLQELVEAGAEANIPPEFIQQALQEIETKHVQSVEQKRKVSLILTGVAILLLLWSGWTYNSFSNAQQKVDTAWAQVENQLQRRTDLIPRLVTMTQTSTGQESPLADRLNQAHQSYLQAKSLTEKISAMNQVSGAITQMQASITHYPKLKSSPIFTNLQYEITGTENRIAVERMRYNQAVENYNQQITSFPNILLSAVFNFQTKPFFQVQEDNLDR